MKNRRFSRLSLNDAQILGREELKHVLGGDGYGGGGYGSGGYCCLCFGTVLSQTSCWYTTSSCADVCNRVYPHSHDNNGGTVDCIGCQMN